MDEGETQPRETPGLDPETRKALAWNERLAARGRNYHICVIGGLLALAPLLDMVILCVFGAVMPGEVLGFGLALVLAAGMGIAAGHYTWKAMNRRILELRSGEYVGRPRDLRECHTMLFMGYLCGYAALFGAALCPRQVVPFAVMLSIIGTVVVGWAAVKRTWFHVRADDSVRKQKYAIPVFPWQAAWLMVLISALLAIMAYYFAVVRIERDWFPVWRPPPV
ncbi:MAG: hypothetical protein NTW87_20425 [Planctomycetota bacterium]|nr:hypothetical protein [Planctomycetota bacterium]